MVDQDDHKARESRSRLDLAGRLFRPNWRLALGSSPMPSQTGANQAPGHHPETTDKSPRPVDVLCSGMYRACSTWQYEVAAHLIEHYLGGRRLGYLTGEQYAALARSDASITGTGTEVEQKSNWRVIKSHEGDRSFARALAEDRAVAVYAYRDVREVVFSLMHKRGKTFEQLLRQGMIHQILANDRFWMARADVLVQRYEDLLADPTRGVIELARHLGIRLDESEAAQIAAEYSHESNKARTEALRRRLQEAGVDLDSAANAQICDPKTLLHWNHIRQGNSQSWQALASPQARRMLNRLCGRWLTSRGYSADADPPGEERFAIRALVRAEIDLMVGRMTFLVRAASLQYPRTVRTIKRLFGLSGDASTGATAWADSASPHSKARRPGTPHITFTTKTGEDEPDLLRR
jgi:Sulfotransferase domain